LYVRIGARVYVYVRAYTGARVLDRVLRKVAQLGRRPAARLRRVLRGAPPARRARPARAGRSVGRKGSGDVTHVHACAAPAARAAEVVVLHVLSHDDALPLVPITGSELAS
jgi:hypothetical protein